MGREGRGEEELRRERRGNGRRAAAAVKKNNGGDGPCVLALRFVIVQGYRIQLADHFGRGARSQHRGQITAPPVVTASPRQPPALGLYQPQPHPLEPGNFFPYRRPSTAVFLTPQLHTYCVVRSAQPPCGRHSQKSERHATSVSFRPRERSSVMAGDDDAAATPADLEFPCALYACPPPPLSYVVLSSSRSPVA